MSVLTELKNRGIQDVLIFCCDGLTGFPCAIEAVFPQAKVQLCIVHLLRQSLRFVGWKERKAVAADLKLIYGSATLEEAETALTTICREMGHFISDDKPNLVAPLGKYYSVFFLSA